MDPAKDNLVIAFRYSSQHSTYDEQRMLIFIDDLKKLCPSKILCATEKGDPSIELLINNDVQVQEYQDFSKYLYTKVIEDFYRISDGLNLLIVSYGIKMFNWQLEHGYNFLRSHNLISVGWRILQQENDGTYLGKLSYNTCMLYTINFFELSKKVGGIPNYVLDDQLGVIIYNVNNFTEEVRIGGQEDLALQLKIYKHLHKKKHKLFGLITHYGIDLNEKETKKTGFNSKIARKVITAEIYRKIEDVNPKDFMDSWQII